MALPGPSRVIWGCGTYLFTKKSRFWGSQKGTQSGRQNGENPVKTGLRGSSGQKNPKKYLFCSNIARKPIRDHSRTCLDGFPSNIGTKNIFWSLDPLRPVFTGFSPYFPLLQPTLAPFLDPKTRFFGEEVGAALYF